jgi:hypothetical protein
LYFGLNSGIIIEKINGLGLLARNYDAPPADEMQPPATPSGRDATGCNSAGGKCNRVAFVSK